MNFISKITTAVFAIASIATVAVADENHETIEKVMKDGLKGKESPMAKLLEGNLDAEGTKSLAELVQTMKDTKAPVGEQEAYEKKVNELIAALDEVAAGKTGAEPIARLKEAQNCKGCHNDHKPKD